MDRLTRHLPRLLRWLAGLLAGGFILCALAISLSRAGFPGQLEWMEGGSLQQVERLRDHKPLYQAPSVEFTPFIYTPLYFQLGALFPPTPDTPFLTLRLLSLAAWLASLLLIAQLVFRWTGSGWWSLFAAGVFAGCFELGGAWFDLARVDSLALALLLAGWLALEETHDGRPAPLWRHSLAAVLLLAAFLAKQNSLTVTLPLILYTLAFHRGARRWLFPVIYLVGLSALVVVLNRATGGWFNYYVFELPAGHALEPSALAGFWRFDLLAPLPFLLAAVVLASLHLLFTRRDRRLAWLLALAVAFVGTAWLGRLHSGGYLNVLLPAYAFLAVWGARSLHHLLEPAFDDPFTAFRQLPAENTENLRDSLVLVVCVLQFALLVYDPRDHLPRPGTEPAITALRTWIRAQPGELWLPTQGWLAPGDAGHGAAHGMALEDVLRGPDGPTREALQLQLEQALTQGRWSAVVLDHPWLEKELAPRYQRVPAPEGAPDALRPLTGMDTAPRYFLRKRTPALPADSLSTE